jgi:hypothetical protein
LLYNTRELSYNHPMPGARAIRCGCLRGSKRSSTVMEFRLKGATSRQPLIPVRIVRGKGAAKTASLLVALLLTPALAVFCWHLAAAGSPESRAPSADPSWVQSAGEDSAHGPQRALDALRPIPNPRFQGESPSARSEAFWTRATREMIVAEGDPFLASLISGAAEGELVVTGTRDSIPVLGPPILGARTYSRADREMLRDINLTLGDSFQKFFANVFRHGEAPEAQSLEAQAAAEENPFREALESLSKEGSAEDSAARPAAAEDSPKNETPKSAATPEPQGQPAVPGSAAISGAATRPLVMLQAGEDGSLHAFAVGHSSEGTFEAAEFGYKKFSLQTYSEIMDLPAALALADFNGDTNTDICLYFSPQGALRFFYGAPDGSFTEGLNIRVGTGPRSLAAGDFDGDGRTDLAISRIGTGLLTILYYKERGVYNARTMWLDVYRDYILAADTTGSGLIDIVGMNFANRAEVLLDSSQPSGTGPARSFEYSPAFTSEIATAGDRRARLNVVCLGSAMAVNVDNKRMQLVNVANSAAGSRAAIVIGDIYGKGRIAVAVAVPLDSK